VLESTLEMIPLSCGECSSPRRRIIVKSSDALAWRLCEELLTPPFKN